MTFLLSRRRRRNNAVLFKYTPGDSLSLATFTRASTATYVGSNGIVQTANTNVARDGHYIGGVRSLLLEGQSTNGALWCRDLTNAAWVKSSATVAKDQTGVDGVANSASSFLATGATAFVQQGIALTGSRTFSVWLKRLVGSGTVRISINGGASYTTTVLTSSWQRFSVSDPAAVSHNIVISIVTSGDSIAVDFAQDEPLAFASSPIPTTAAAVTRSTDALSLPWAYSPMAQTLYAKFFEAGSVQTSFGSILAVGNASRYYSLSGKSSGGAYLAEYGSPASDSTAAAAPNIGDTVELRGLLSSGGAAQLGQSINGAAEVVAAAGTAQGMAGAWSTPTLYVCGPSGLLNPGFAAIQSLKIASAVQSLATMRGL